MHISGPWWWNDMAKIAEMNGSLSQSTFRTDRLAWVTCCPFLPLRNFLQNHIIGRHSILQRSIILSYDGTPQMGYDTISIISQQQDNCWLRMAGIALVWGNQTAPLFQLWILRQLPNGTGKTQMAYSSNVVFNSVLHKSEICCILY